MPPQRFSSAPGFISSSARTFRPIKPAWWPRLVSGLFLTSYLTYHYNVGNVRFTKEGWIRNIYFPLLITHTILAAVILPMVLRTAFLAFKGRFRNHVRIAKWTFPTWMYVSVTGVVVYLMLYR